MRKPPIADRSNQLFTPQSGPQFSIFLARWSSRMAIGGLALILTATLFPFNFSISSQLSPGEIISHFNESGNIADQIGNIALFAPFGFGMAGFIRRWRCRWQAVLIAGLLSCSVSTLVELLQFFLPLRSPTVTDIVTNSGGGLVGAMLLVAAEHGVDQTPAVLRWLQTRLAIKIWSVLLIGYLLLTAAIAMALPLQTQLSAWDPSFPLVLGNEPTGDRPWQGQIISMSIYDRALSPTDIHAFLAGPSPSVPPLAQYQPAAPGLYIDQTGQFPDIRRDTESNPNEAAGNFANLIQPIRQSSQFTVAAIVATEQIVQTGPARIVSISSGPLLRNFTLGQQRNQLAIRLRMPITGENGRYPELLIPDVFLDRAPHRIVVTYQSSLLTCYIDQVERVYSIHFIPAIGFFRYLVPSNEWSIQLTTVELWTY